MFQIQHPAKQKFLPGFLGALVQAAPHALTDYAERQIAASREQARREEALAALGIKAQQAETAAKKQEGMEALNLQKFLGAEQKNEGINRLNQARIRDLEGKQGQREAINKLLAPQEGVESDAGQLGGGLDYENLSPQQRLALALQNPAAANVAEREREFKQRQALSKEELALKQKNRQEDLNIAAGEAALKEKNRQEDIERTQTKERRKEIDESYKTHADYMGKVRAERASADAQEADFDIMNQLIDSKGLTDSRLVNLANAIGFPLGLLGNPSNEEYEKKALNITKNIISEYGNRPLLQEFQVLLKRIPSLMNTDEGKRQIIEDMRVIQKISNLRSDTMERIVEEAKEKGEPLPRDLEGEVNAAIKGDVKQAYDWIKNRNGRIKVEPGTPISDEKIDWYLNRFRDFKSGKVSEKNMKDAEAAAREDGYDI
jgi:hypothetical protein